MVAITAKFPRLMKFEKSKALQDKVHAVIPGGCHTYAKGDDQYPVLAPGFIARGLGCHVWDQTATNTSNMAWAIVRWASVTPIPPYWAAVQQELTHGCNFTRPAPIEVACA